MQPQPKPPFDNLEAANGVCVVDGWGLKIYINQGHLVVEDGIGQSRRTRRYHKAISGLTRLVILGHSGYQTLEAVRWLSDAKISVIHIDSDGTILTTTTRGSDNPALRRAQAWAAANETGLEISRFLLTSKISRQQEVASRLNVEAEEIGLALQAARTAESLGELRVAEMQAAVHYWQTWAPVEIRFVRSDIKRVPEHWRALGSRHSPQGTSGRRAVNPINAILNYLYALLEAEARIATIAVGLDPGLGINHLDTYARDSFGLDLMEAIRPEVDAYVLDLIEGHHFRASDFHDTRSGICRIARPLAHVLSETTLMWRNRLAEPAETVTRLLAATPGIDIGKVRTPLTQSNRRKAKGSTWPSGNKREPRLSKHCQRCGDPATDSGKLCSRCLGQFKDDAEWLKAGRERLASMRLGGNDPAHGGKAAEKRAAKVGAENRKSGEWNRTNRSRPESDEFHRQILPLLESVTLKDMAIATGLSIDYCSKIKRGLKTPHPRHWAAFAALTMVERTPNSRLQPSSGQDLRKEPSRESSDLSLPAGNFDG